MLFLRPYQLRAVDFCAVRKRAFTQAPAGSGKTIIGASVVKATAQPFCRVVWMCNTREQVDQAWKAIKASEIRTPCEFHVCCAASLPDVSTADILIIDECHHLPAVTWWQTAVVAVGRIYGLSATPWSGDWERDQSLRAFFGEENFIEIPRDEVRNAGCITEGLVFMHHVDEPGSMDEQIHKLATEEAAKRAKRWRFLPIHEHYRRAQWQFSAQAIIANAKRNDRIVELANQGDAVLVLVSSIEHGQALAERIIGSAVCFSKIGKKKRRELIENFRTGVLRCMIATSLADEGLDVPRASVLILASGGRSASKIEQRAGRVMRPHETKTFGTVHDFADEAITTCAKQAQARMKTYKKLGYKISHL